MSTEREIVEKLNSSAHGHGLDVAGGNVRRTSSRFCLGVEHGDYNGTELFGIGTDRFIWLAYKPNSSGMIRIFSGNFPDEGVIEFSPGKTPGPKDPAFEHSWARFPFGCDYILNKAGLKLGAGFDAALFGNIPGGGMSRSASLAINLILTMLEVNKIEIAEPMKIVDYAQAVENEYIGSPCGKLDQIMILFAKESAGTHYNPQDNSINYIPFGGSPEAFRIAVMDTGTVRPGLEKSTYKVRRAECEQLVRLAKQNGYEIGSLGEVKDRTLYETIRSSFAEEHPQLVKRLDYIYHAQQRFYKMMDAWRSGDIETVGSVFRTDGIGLRDDYEISGPQLETMCDIARTVPGVLGERMLGGGDKGASGAIVRADGTDALRQAVETAYPRSRPEYADNFAFHCCKMVQGVKVFDNRQ